MTPRDRLLAPLRRSPAQDDVSRALAAVFGAETLDQAAFSGELLRRVPLERLQATVDGLRSATARYGTCGGHASCTGCSSRGARSWSGRRCLPTGS